MQKENPFFPLVDKSWTLFLDRDGVINQRLPGKYVRSPEEFIFLPGVPEAIAKLSAVFGRIVVVTNQQGVAKGLMTIKELHLVHDFMLERIVKEGGRIDAVYFCPHLAGSGCECRKPEVGMFRQAQQEFPEISAERSIMLGDSPSDMEFANAVAILSVASDANEKTIALAKCSVRGLSDLSTHLLNQQAKGE